MKKIVVVLTGILLVLVHTSGRAVTCASEQKVKGYEIKVLSPTTGTVINKNAAFLIQYLDPIQSLGMIVNVGLHELKKDKKSFKPVKKLSNQPNTGNILMTGANLTQPGTKGSVEDQYFLRISGAGNLVIDSECFSFAPARRHSSKPASSTDHRGLQFTVQSYATQINSLSTEAEAIKEQLVVTGAAALKDMLSADAIGIPQIDAEALGEMLAEEEHRENQSASGRAANNALVGFILRLLLQRVNALTSELREMEGRIDSTEDKLDQLWDAYYAEGQQGDLHRHAIQNDHTHEIEASDYIPEVSRVGHRHHFVGTTLVPLWDKFETGPAKPEMTITTGTGASCTGSGC